jgi:hypothetical protein
MKKLLTFLFLLIASPAYAQFITRTDCGTFTPVQDNAAICLQITTASGRTAGHVYAWRSSAWVDVDTSGSGAPTDATYITQTANGTLSAEQALGALATGILKNTTITGVLSIATEGTDYYKPGGTDVAVADGGTGRSTLTIHGVLIGNATSGINATSAGTAGQVLTSNGASADPTFQSVAAASCPTCVTSAAALTANRIVIGSGSQGSQVLTSLGTTIQVLHGNVGGAPTWGAVALTTDVSGILPVISGGTNLATATDDNLMVGNGTTWQSRAVPHCTDTGGQHLNYDTSTNAFACGTSGGGGGGGGAFSAITTGTNTTATMTVGTGASMVPSGSGVIQASHATNPKITTGLLDTNGNPMIAFTPTASAVDGITITNAATANPATVTLAATGSDSNINLAFNPKGTGAAQFGDCSTNCATIDTAAVTGSKTFTLQNVTGTLALTSLAGGGTNQTSWTASRCVQVNSGGTALESASGACGAGAGSVTSVGWTGGIVSIATATTTPAFTIAGTSGGIPYFSSSSTWASSGALTVNLPVIGGGAGTAPTVGTRSGNTTAFVTTTGTQTSGDCVTIDTNGNHIASGAACGGGSVTGSGSAGQITYWTGASTIAGSSTLQWDDTNGTMGINVTPSSTRQLTVKGDATNASGAILVTNSAATIEGLINANSPDAIVQLGSLTNHPLVFYSNSVERFRINAAGTVTFPTGGLVLDKQMSINSTADAFTIFTLKGVSGTSDDGNMTFHSANDSVKAILSASQGNSEITFGATTNHPVKFYSNNTLRSTISAAGQILHEALKTTGSAGSKNVVCVDTSTGQLYASSTGTDCSN